MAVVNTRMVGGGGIAGTVVDTAGQPIVGADIGADITEFNQPSTTAAANGRFRLGFLPPSTVQFPSVHKICVSAPRYTTRCDISATITEFTTTQVGRVVLTRES